MKREVNAHAAEMPLKQPVVLLTSGDFAFHVLSNCSELQQGAWKHNKHAQYEANTRVT